MSLASYMQEQVESYIRTSRGKDLLKNASLTQDQVKQRLEYWTQRLADIIQDETINIVSDTTGKAYLSKLRIGMHVIAAYSSVNFAGALYRDSLYKEKYDEPVYLPALINNPHAVHSTRYAYGYDRHGRFIRSAPKNWPAQKGLTGFLKRVKERFDAEARDRGVTLEFNPIYEI